MNFAYTTNSDEDQGLQFVTDAANTTRAAQTPPLPPLTPSDYLSAIVASILTSYQQQAVDSGADAVKQAYIAADPATRDAIMNAATAVNVKPGPLPPTPAPLT